MIPARKNIIAFGVQYSISILSGVVAFLFLSLIARRLEADLFSQVSLVVQLLPLYLICTDLGSHNQHILNVNAAPAESIEKLNADLVVTRLCFALFAWCIAVVHGLASGFETQTLQMMLLYLSCLVPFAFLSSLDTIFFALGQEKKGLVLRLFRIAGMLAATAAAFLAVRAQPLFLIGAFSATVWLGSLVLIWTTLRQAQLFSVRALRESLASFAFLQRLSPYRHTAPLFLAVMFFSLLVQSILVRTFGDRNLSDWTSAVAFVTPFTIALQTLAQLAARPISKCMSNAEQLTLAIRRYRLRFGLISSVLMIAYALMVFLEINLILFPHSTAVSIPLIFGNAIYQILILFPNVEVLLLQQRRQSAAAMNVFIFSCVPTLVALFFFAPTLGLNGIMAGMIGQSILCTLGILRLAYKKNQTPMSQI